MAQHLVGVLAKLRAATVVRPGIAYLDGACHLAHDSELGVRHFHHHLVIGCLKVLECLLDGVYRSARDLPSEQFQPLCGGLLAGQVFQNGHQY